MSFGRGEQRDPTMGSISRLDLVEHCSANGGGAYDRFRKDENFVEKCAKQLGYAAGAGGSAGAVMADMPTWPLNEGRGAPMRGW